jgi:sugar/nucleoside kinase (ribokinase family)
MSLVVVGSIGYDCIETPHGKVDRILGGSCAFTALSASYFTRVKIVAVVGDDFTTADAALLSSRGIDLEGLAHAPGKTFYWSGKYSADMSECTTLATDLHVFADFNPKLPDSYRTEPYLLLGNIQPSLQRRVRAQMNSLRFTGGDTMIYWIRDHRDALLAAIKEWDFLLIDDIEARMLAGDHSLRRAAEKIQRMGPQTLVIKRGEYGAILFSGSQHFVVPGFLLEEVFDPTGAGDCFAGGFMGYLAQQGARLHQGEIDHQALRRAVIYGSVMASFCCEKFGPERFRTLTHEDIDDRYREFKAFTNF